jgi:hypothetical protein
MTFRHLETPLNRIQQRRFLRRPEGRLYDLRAIRLISLKRLHQRRLFRCSGCRKFLRMDYCHLETSTNPLHQSRFLRRPEGGLWVIRATNLPNTSVKQLHESRFFLCSACRKCVRMAFRQLETSLHRLKQTRFFKTSWRQIMISQAHSST